MEVGGLRLADEGPQSGAIVCDLIPGCRRVFFNFTGLDDRTNVSHRAPEQHDV